MDEEPDLVVALRRACETARAQLGETSSPRLRVLLDMILVEIARERASPAERAHPRG